MDEEKKVPQVAQSAGLRKKSAFRKFTDNFIQEDIGTVKGHIVEDILIPTIKKAISDVVSNGIDMILYGSEGRRDKNWGSNKASRITMTAYNSIFDSGRRNTRQEQRQSNVYDYGQVTVHTIKAAEDVLRCMDEIISQYHMASIADLYDLVGEVGNPTDHRYGWTDFSKAKYERLPNGDYLIVTPRAELLQTSN